MVRFCNYRERCRFEIEQKMKQLKYSPKTCDKVMDWLVEGEYFNDARYAHSYVQGKFNIKHWGKLKIRAGLFKKRINGDHIKSAIESIDHESYLEKARELVENKVSLDPDCTYEKLTRYLLQKGFEPEVTYAVLKVKNS